MRPEPPQLHDQDFTIGEIRAVGEYGLRDRVSARVQIPFKIQHTSVRYRHLDGTPYVPDYVNIHHRKETLVGLGDPWLSVKAGTQLIGLAVAGQIGVSVPLGSTAENPSELAQQGLEHQHIQFGTGIFAPIVGLEVAKGLGRFGLELDAQAHFMLYENGHGYRAGNRYLGGLHGTAILVEKLGGTMGVEVVSQAPERWNGRILEDGQLGRTDVLLGGALAYPIGPLGLSLGVKVPVYRHSTTHEHEQVTAPAILTLSLGWSP